MKKANGSAPRPSKTTPAPAPPPKPPPVQFDEARQMATAKALRAKRKAPMKQDTDDDGE